MTENALGSPGLEQTRTDRPRTNNPNGRPPGRRETQPRAPRLDPKIRESFIEVYRRQVESNAQRLVRKSLQMALKGDSRMIIDIFDRYLGKAIQSIELSGPGGGPLRLQAMTAVALAQLDEGELRALEALNQRLAQATEPQPVALLPAQSVSVESQPDPEVGITTQPSITT